MKVGNWTKKLAGAILAAGIWIPSVAFAANIPLADASFEDFVVPSAGYAYADEYRPTSAWIDDPDSAGMDNVDSNWLYDAAYDNTRRPAPRTGNQAMHGGVGGNYNGQETSAVFEADKIYRFSLWAQGDSDATDVSSRIWMYIYDASVPFSQANSLEYARYAPDTGDFANRVVGSSVAESQANWTQITLSHVVSPGAPEIGHPVGVAFWSLDDNAVDDASLSVDNIPEPTTVVLVGLGGVLLLGYRCRE